MTAAYFSCVCVEWDLLIVCYETVWKIGTVFVIVKELVVVVVDVGQDLQRYHVVWQARQQVLLCGNHLQLLLVHVDVHGVQCFRDRCQVVHLRAEGPQVWLVVQECCVVEVLP